MKIKDFPEAVINENVDYTVKEITSVIKRYGPRESGNKNCLATQKHIDKEMKPFCDETGFEEYKMAPKAFLHFTKPVAFGSMLAIFVNFILVYLGVYGNVGLGEFFIPHCILAGILIVSLFITAMEFLFYKEFLDPFHKKVEGHNYYAVRKPKGEVKKRIVISGHCDAAYQWRHIFYTKKVPLMGLLMFGTIGGAIISVIVSILTIISAFVNMGGFSTFLMNYSFYIYGILFFFMITLLLFVDFKTISPGANDNLTGTYSAVCALRMLDMAGVEFENTEVVAMITDGEEAGLRGCKNWAKKHKEEYTNPDVETVILCVDTLTDLNDLNVYSKDMTGTVKNDEKFSQLVMDSAKDAGHNDLKFSSVYFGSSDAAAFSQAGIKATCLAAMDPTPADYYHNLRDNYDRLVPEAIKTGYEIILSTIFNFDEKGLK